MKYLACFLIATVFSIFLYGKPDTDSSYLKIPEREDSKYISAEMKFETNDNIYDPSRSPFPWVSRWVCEGTSNKDNVVFAEGKNSLRLNDNCNAYYYLDASRIEGDSLFFSGKYKYAKGVNGKLYFYILQKDRYESVEWPPVPDSLIIDHIRGNSEWKTFSIRAKLKKGIQEIRFGLKLNGFNNVWIDDWDIQVDNLPVYRFVKSHYPAEEDKEFDNGSNIRLGELTPQIHHNLNVLGRVWGFLKYYHPKITDGDVNWDYELFRVLPEAANAPDKDALNLVFLKWIEKFGSFPETKYAVTDTFAYSCLIDNSWINDRELFSDEMIEALNKVERAVRSEKVNYYAIPFAGGARHRNFRAEKVYPDIQWSDQGFRILTLFRFWNVMQYNFPYKYLTDNPWDKVLYDHIPDFFSPETEAQYMACLMKLTAELDDSHGRVLFNKSLAGSPAERMKYRQQSPAALTETSNGEFCVERTSSSKLLPGDVIISVEGTPVRDIFNSLVPYVTASNYNTLSRNIRPHLLRTDQDSLRVEIKRNGEIIPLTLRAFGMNSNVTSEMKGLSDYARSNKDIIFLDLGTKSSLEMITIIQNNRSAKGIVFDLRNYPRDFMSFFKLSEELLPKQAINLWFSSQDLAYLGNYRKYNECPIGLENNPDYFKGKVAILVNEYTQSLGEMTSIALRNAPVSAVIGTSTAGADGNATSFMLPGDIRVAYTVLGAYYPNWGQCQRTGVRIDIEVRPTVEDIIQKKDALIEKAIEYIRN